VLKEVVMVRTVLPVVCWVRAAGRGAAAARMRAVKQQPQLGRREHARPRPPQRPTTTQGASQPRTRRSVTGQQTSTGWLAWWAGPLPPRGPRGGGGLGGGRLGGVIGEPGLPAERERTPDQLPVAADRAVRAGLEVGPAQLVLDLLVALLDPVAQAVQAYHLGQVGRRERRRRPPRARAGRLVIRYQVESFGNLAGSVVATTSRRRRSRPQPAAGRLASAAHQVSAWPSRNRRVTGVQSPGCSGLHHASCRAASTGV
jgi:hypothetical protein